MAKIEKAYIIRINDTISQQYAATAAESCIMQNIPYEFIQGCENKTQYDAWKDSGISIPNQEKLKKRGEHKATCATVSHVLTWLKMCEDNVGAAIILEHDSIMLHKPDIDIPDNAIVALGYKVKEPTKYNHKSAGNVKEIERCRYHEGAHAYAITKETANILLSELRDRGQLGAVDNAYFLRNRKTRVPLYIADPTPAIGWLRESTIWSRSATRNAPFIKSFADHWSG